MEKANRGEELKEEIHDQIFSSSGKEKSCGKISNPHGTDLEISEQTPLKKQSLRESELQNENSRLLRRELLLRIAFWTVIAIFAILAIMRVAYVVERKIKNAEEN